MTRTTIATTTWLLLLCLSPFGIAQQLSNQLDALDDAGLSVAEPQQITEDPFGIADEPGFDEPPGAETDTQPNEDRFLQIQMLEMKIRNHKGKNDKRDRMVEQLTTLMEQVFDEDYARREESVTKLETRVATLRAALDERKAARERIIKNRIDGLLLESDGLAFPLQTNRTKAQFDVQSIQQQGDGSYVAKVRIPQVRFRTVAYQVMVPQQRTRTVKGVPQQYTVMVPQTRTRQHAYTVNAPSGGDVHQVKIPKGQDINAYISQFASQRQQINQRNERSILEPKDNDIFGPSNPFDGPDDGQLFDAPQSKSGDDEPFDDLFG